MGGRRGEFYKIIGSRSVVVGKGDDGGERRERSVIISFRLFYDDEIDRFILKKLDEVEKGERTKVIKEALYFYFSR